MVPHLVTALTGPINELEQRVLDSMPAIERWFRLEWMEHTPPFYSSVDIRNAGFKLAPVDTNLYPGRLEQPHARRCCRWRCRPRMAAIEKICPEARNLLVIPENHTRNTFYLANVAQLVRIFHMAGLNVRVGSIDPAIKSPKKIELPDGEHGVPGAGGAQQAAPGAEGLRPLHHPAQQRPVGRHARHPGRPARAVPAAAAACRLVGAAQEQPLPQLRRSVQALRQAAGHRPLADQPDVRQCGEVDFAEGTGMDVPDQPTSMRC